MCTTKESPTIHSKLKIFNPTDRASQLFFCEAFLSSMEIVSGFEMCQKAFTKVVRLETNVYIRCFDSRNSFFGDK